MPENGGRPLRSPSLWITRFETPPEASSIRLSDIILTIAMRLAPVSWNTACGTLSPFSYLHDAREGGGEPVLPESLPIDDEDGRGFRCNGHLKPIAA
jgi:hypothetical protein